MSIAMRLWDKAANCLYLYHLVGRLVTRVRRGAGSHEYSRVNQRLQVPDAWTYLTRDMLFEALRDPESEHLWNRLRDLREDLDALTGGNRRIGLVPRNQDALRLLSREARIELSQATALAPEEVLDRIFDGGELEALLLELNVALGPSKQTPTVLLQYVLKDADILQRIDQESLDLFELLEDALHPEAAGALERFYSGSTLGCLRTVVQAVLNDRPAAIDPHEDPGDYFAGHVIRERLAAIQHAVERLALESLREAQKTAPLHHELRELRLASELRLAGDYRQAAALLLMDKLPIRSLGITAQVETPGLKAAGGKLVAERAREPAVKRFLLRSERGPHDVAIYYQAPTGGSTVLAYLVVPDEERASLVLKAFEGGVDLSDLPTSGRALDLRLLEMPVALPAAEAAANEEIKTCLDDLAVVFELADLDPDAESVLTALQARAAAHEEEATLRGVTSAEAFLVAFETHLEEP